MFGSRITDSRRKQDSKLATLRGRAPRVPAGEATWQDRGDILHRLLTDFDFGT